MSSTVNVTKTVDCIYITPQILSSQGEQLRSCIEKLKISFDPDNSFIYSITVFISASNSSEFKDQSGAVRNALQDSFSPLPPLVIIAEAPLAPAQIAFEVIIRSREPEQSTTYSSFRGLSYLLIQDQYGKELVTGGVSHPDLNEAIDAQSQGCFEFMQQLLSHHGFTFADVVRQWNYIERIVDNFGDSQRYQIFNDVRSVYYSKANFVNGYPAATGIGTAAGGITLAVIAYQSSNSSKSLLPLHNPLQSDAHRYTPRVLADNSLCMEQNKTTPKFERGKIIDSKGIGVLHVSGTAAIKGEDTVELGNVAAQTSITLDNIESLISIENIREQHPTLGYTQREILNLRVYVKEPKDFQLALDVCSSRFPKVPSIAICADVCRPCLLVEIECLVRCW